MLHLGDGDNFYAEDELSLDERSFFLRRVLRAFLLLFCLILFGSVCVIFRISCRIMMGTKFYHDTPRTGESGGWKNVFSRVFLVVFGSTFVCFAFEREHFLIVGTNVDFDTPRVGESGGTKHGLVCVFCLFV